MIGDILRAIRDTAIFVAFVGFLLTAPTWGKWLDQLGTDPVTATAAERHWEAYRERECGR